MTRNLQPSAAVVRVVRFPTAAPFTRAAVEEQRRLALPVLLAARELVLAGAAPVDAIAEAGNGTIAAEFARRALRGATFEVNLLTWQSRAGITASDKTRAFDRAIRLCRSVEARRGGWQVSR